MDLHLEGRASMRNLARLSILAVFLLALPIPAQVQKPAPPKAKPMFTQDVGPGGGSGGSCVSDTCYRVCRDGSVSSIGCNTYENAYCGCDGLSHGGSVQAYPTCTPCTS
jgi:hypothetical protein